MRDILIMNKNRVHTPCHYHYVCSLFSHKRNLVIDHFIFPAPSHSPTRSLIPLLIRYFTMLACSCPRFLTDSTLNSLINSILQLLPHASIASLAHLLTHLALSVPQSTHTSTSDSQKVWTCSCTPRYSSTLIIYPNPSFIPVCT